MASNIASYYSYKLVTAYSYSCSCLCLCVMMCVYSKGEAFILTHYSFSISHYFSYSYMLTDLPIIPKIMLDLKLMALETANIAISPVK